MNNLLRPIAIYLPQFHPIPENDAWWGKGFTEWTNVTKARPLFRKHLQPKLPKDLGFYDLRLSETRKSQEKMARDYGINGFCYYHYWFNGKRLLSTPLDLKLSSPDEDLPFMICWANESWSRRWLGEEKEILIQQTYNLEDYRNHAEWLYSKVFQDSRYIRVNNKPVFVLYRPLDIQFLDRFLEIFNQVAILYNDLPPYFIASNSHSSENLSKFDNILNFEPQLSLLPDAFNDKVSFNKFWRNLKMGVFSSKLKIYDYHNVKMIMKSKHVPKKFIPCVFVGWDNTPRRGQNGIIITNQNLKDFKDSLLWAKAVSLNNSPSEQFVFINAWNEWAEGNYLEPDSLNGFTFLEAIKEVFLK